RLCPSHDGVGLRKRGPLLGQPLGAEHVLGEREQLAGRQLVPAGATEDVAELALAEAVLSGAGAPVLPQLGHVDVLLALARHVRRELRGVVTTVARALDHLSAAAGKLPDRSRRDVPDLGHALPGLLPLDTERPGQLGAELGLVEVPGGKAVALEN